MVKEIAKITLIDKQKNRHRGGKPDYIFNSFKKDKLEDSIDGDQKQNQPTEQEVNLPVINRSQTKNMSEQMKYLLTGYEPVVIEQVKRKRSLEEREDPKWIKKMI